MDRTGSERDFDPVVLIENGSKKRPKYSTFSLDLDDSGPIQVSKFGKCTHAWIFLLNPIQSNP